MKGRFWNLWAVVTALAALILMVLWTFSPGEHPAVSEPLPPVSVLSDRPECDRVDLNSADADRLMALPGIGPAEAEAIVEYRKAHGPFRYPEELIYVPGIGEAAVEELLEFITAGGG